MSRASLAPDHRLTHAEGICPAVTPARSRIWRGPGLPHSSPSGPARWMSYSSSLSIAEMGRDRGFNLLRVGILPPPAVRIEQVAATRFMTCTVSPSDVDQGLISRFFRLILREER